MSNLPLYEQNDLRSKSLSARSARFCEWRGGLDNIRSSNRTGGKYEFNETWHREDLIADFKEASSHAEWGSLSCRREFSWPFGGDITLFFHLYGWMTFGHPTHPFIRKTVRFAHLKICFANRFAHKGVGCSSKTDIIIAINRIIISVLDGNRTGSKFYLLWEGNLR